MLPVSQGLGNALWTSPRIKYIGGGGGPSIRYKGKGTELAGSIAERLERTNLLEDRRERSMDKKQYLKKGAGREGASHSIILVERKKLMRGFTSQKKDLIEVSFETKRAEVSMRTKVSGLSTVAVVAIRKMRKELDSNHRLV